MPDEKPEVEEVEQSYFDEVRADVETAVYAFVSMQEVDTALFGRNMQKNIARAKNDCIFIICKGLTLIREGYKASEDDE